MNPSIDDRLGSVIRSLSHIVLPALPPQAALAIEQLQLAIRQLQVIRNQVDEAPAFEAEELEDLQGLARAMLAGPAGAAGADAALDRLREALDTTPPAESTRQRRIRLNEAVERVISEAMNDGSASYQSHLRRVVLQQQAMRTAKDRAWHAKMGLDPEWTAQQQGAAPNGASAAVPTGSRPDA